MTLLYALVGWYIIGTVIRVVLGLESANEWADVAKMVGVALVWPVTLVSWVVYRLRERPKK